MSYPDFQFRGIFSAYVKELTTANKMHPKIFQDYYSAYLFCAIYGALQGAMRDYNPSTDDDGTEASTIRSEVFLNKSNGLYSYDTIRKIVLLFDNSRKLEFKEKIDYALRFDLPIEESLPESLKRQSKYNENTELFNRYALGGLVLIYDKLVNVSSKEDLIDTMCQIRDDFNSAIGMSNNG